MSDQAVGRRKALVKIPAILEKLRHVDRGYALTAVLVVEPQGVDERRVDRPTQGNNKFVLLEIGKQNGPTWGE